MRAMATQSMEAPLPSGDTARGFAFALSAYLLWGVLPFYMKAVAHIPTLEVIAHRVVWSVPVAGLILLWLGRTADVRAALSNPRTLAMGAVTAALISINWGIYIWAIAAGRAVETALGYYINPLLAIVLAAMFLGERLSRAQWLAIALAALAVGVLTWDSGGLPWVSVGLAVSWGLYAFAKRTLPIGAAQGFFLEVLILFMPCLGYAIWLEATGVGHFAGPDTADMLLLLGAGLVTAVPLILYANGAKLLTLSTIGIMQYLSPTLIFLIAVFAFREPFSTAKAVAFGLIWTALVIYSLSMFRGRRPATK